jgi:hypothetical protein
LARHEQRHRHTQTLARLESELAFGHDAALGVGIGARGWVAAHAHDHPHGQRSTAVARRRDDQITDVREPRVFGDAGKLALIAAATTRVDGDT